MLARHVIIQYVFIECKEAAFTTLERIHCGAKFSESNSDADDEQTQNHAEDKINLTNPTQSLR